MRYEPNALERLLQLTRLVNLADIEAAVSEALSRGSFFFADIQNNQVSPTGLAILRFIAKFNETAILSRQTLSQ